MKKIIETNNLKKYYQRGKETVKALDGVDFEISSGELAAVVGPSGSGKTTLMNLISCLDLPTAGNLKIAGIDVSKYKESQLIHIRRENIGFIFQQFYLIPTLTVKENIELPAIFGKKEINNKLIYELLEKIGLIGKENFQINMLSGGDKQRVSIARSLINNPQILLADEPTGKLETQVRDSIIEIFQKLAKDGLAVFIATHDLDLAAQTQRIIHLQDGRIIPKNKSDLYN